MQSVEATSGDVKVLVVDDSQDAADMLAMLLRATGYTVATAHSGEQALAQVETFMPHCIILDVVMPGMTGNVLTQRLRESGGEDIVLIAVSGYDADDPRVAQTFDLVDHYFVKPVDPALLVKILPPVE